MLRAAVGLRLRIEGRAGPEGLGWKAKEFGLDAEGSGEPSKVLESLTDLARFVFGKIIDLQCVGCSDEPDLPLHRREKASLSVPC